jgi:uncharacterized protein
VGFTAQSGVVSTSSRQEGLNVSEPMSERTTLHRYAHRGLYDRPSIDAILDQGFVCHLGVQTDRGFPVVVPLAYGRKDDTVYLHGSAASRLFRSARKEAAEVCMTVTFVDGLVVARSTYNTDINYRSVMIMGEATEVTDLDEKRAGLDCLVEHIIPGRTRDAREPTEKELRSTTLLTLPITESSAKVRTGWPEDEPDDYDLSIWAGVLAIDQRVAPPATDPALRFALEPPDYLVNYPRFS